MLQSVLGRVGAAYSNTKVNSSLQILKEHQTPIVIPRAQVHLLLTTHRPHTRWRSSWRGRSSSACLLPSPSSSRFLRSSLLPSSRSSSGPPGGAGSSHQNIKNLKRTTFSSDINEITSSTKCNILNVGPVPVQYLFLYPGLHQRTTSYMDFAA